MRKDGMDTHHDMHCHLGFMTNGEEVARDARTRGVLLFCNTVSPQEYAEARARFDGFDNVTVGFGMHPWWVVGASGHATAEADSIGTASPDEARTVSQRTERKMIKEQAQRESNADAPAACAQRGLVLEALDETNPPIVGEIGLDFGRTHMTTRSEQLAMFSQIATWAAQKGGKLVSIHAVKSTDDVLRILNEAGCLKTCTCVFHWFTGSSDLLKRAIQAGCYFSCGPRMLATGKGREYVKAIPTTQLLLETDAPPARGVPYSFAELNAELGSVAQSIAIIKGENALTQIAETSVRLLKNM